MRRLPRPSARELGATKTNAKGYVLEKTTAGWVMQHRVVLERALGRPLQGDENVHHANGERDDNVIGNLELWTTMQPSGKRAVDLVAFALQVLDRYGHLVGTPGFEPGASRSQSGRAA